MPETSIFFFSALLALFAFFVVGPCILNAISLFGVQKKFAATMVAEGVVEQSEVDRLHPKKQIAGVIISVVVLAALAVGCINTAPMGLLTGGVALVASFLKYRKIVEFNSLTVQRFRNTYQDTMNHDKYNRYVDKHF